LRWWFGISKDHIRSLRIKQRASITENSFSQLLSAEEIASIAIRELQ
jgi:hypothetical protein